MQNRTFSMLLFFFVQCIFAQETLQTETTQLFNGKNLDGWHTDVPAMDKKPDLPNPFYVKDGNLATLSSPRGHIITDKSYQNYRLTVEYRFSGVAKNGGVLVHVSTPRAQMGMFPKSIECQLMTTNAGDFYSIIEDYVVDDMEKRRKPKFLWGTRTLSARRSPTLIEGVENPVGEWNTYVVECFENKIKIWVNGKLVNYAYDVTASSGQIALQAEGSEMEFRKVELQPISGLSN